MGKRLLLCLFSISMLFGVTYAEAPEVDGTIMFSLKNKGLKPGDFTMVKITGAGPYDMEGEEI